MLVCISSTWNNIFFSKTWFGFSGFIWDCLRWGAVYLDHLGLNAFLIVNIISLTSVGTAFDNLEKKIQIKFPAIQVFFLSYKSQCQKMGTTENLEK